MTNDESEAQPKAPETKAVRLNEIAVGRQDDTGKTIDRIYFRHKDYAIYRRDTTPPDVVVKYSDDAVKADQQVKAISAPLLSRRDKVIHLLNDLPATSQESLRSQVADALRLGLENQVEAARRILDDSIADALVAQGRRGRLIYLVCAGIATVPALILFLIGGSVASGSVRQLLMSAGAGTIGAVSSIFIGIRARTVAIEGDWMSNAVASAIRVAIGIISAAVLFLLFDSHVIPDIKVGTVLINDEIDQKWQLALLVGFIAGFLERLVPDLLERQAPVMLGAGAAGVAPANPSS